MEAETYKKTGRGGAGNYYSKHDIEEATKQIAEVSILPKESQNGLADHCSAQVLYLPTRYLPPSKVVGWSPCS